MKEIAPKLKDAVKNMHEFFAESYKGIYCTMCNSPNHMNFNVKGNKVVFSQKFCRDIVANTLHVLLYFDMHFLKFIDLVTRFVTSCNAKGVFKDEPISTDITLGASKHASLLETCKEYRNDPTWFSAC